MKLIFLDVDGVLNYGGCKSRAPSGCLGVEEEKVKLIRQIIDETGAIVILTSTWKTEWFPTAFISELPKDGRYLEEQLAKHNVFIRAKTEDPSWSRRGRGILDFLSAWPDEVESYVIIDDESFDFEQEGISDKHVHTSFVDGILPEHVAQAIDILNTNQ